MVRFTVQRYQPTATGSHTPPQFSPVTHADRGPAATHRCTGCLITVVPAVRLLWLPPPVNYGNWFAYLGSWLQLVRSTPTY